MSEMNLSDGLALGMTAAALLALGLTTWLDRYSKRRLAEAIDYWRKSQAIWDALGDVPDERFTPEAADLLERFVADKTDQRGSLPSDYVAPSSSI